MDRESEVDNYATSNTSNEAVLLQNCKPCPVSVESFDPGIFQLTPKSSEVSIKVPSIPEFPSSQVVAPQSSSDSSHITFSEHLGPQSQILFLASQPVLDSSDLENFSNSVPPFENCGLKADEISVAPMQNILLKQKCHGLCRICANESTKSMPLFHNEGVALCLVEKIHHCLPIEISINDDLPQQICDKCFSKLEICNSFRNISIEGNAKLQAMLASWSRLDTQAISSNAVKDSIENGVEMVSDVTMISQVETDLPPLEPHNLKAKEGNTSGHPTEVLLSQNVTKTVMQLDFRDRQWSCNECDYKASRQSSLALHKQTKHKDAQNTSQLSKNKISLNLGLNASFTCELCHQIFQSKTKLMKHNQEHKNSRTGSEDTQVCTLCNETFSDFKNLQEHSKSVHSLEQESKFNCDRCDKSFRVARSLDIHRATHSNETAFLCDTCGKSFKHSSNLRCHKRSHAGMKVTHRHTCDLCSKSFPSKFHLNEHKNVHLDVTPYPCGVCGKSFHRRIQLRQHRIIHTQSSYECPQCGISFNRRGNMTQHMKRHMKEQKFTCKVCKESFQTLSEVVQHRRHHTDQEQSNHSNRRGIYSCSKCQQSFSCSNKFQEHKKSSCSTTAKTDPKLQCELCSKKLSNRRTLEYHMRSFHTQDRPFKCQYCSESFISRESCQVHERHHTGEKPYSCSECEMSFRCSSNLTQHLRTHRDERPWACDHCPKSFKRKGILLVHMRTHTGEKPFCCDVCGRRFTQKNDMLKHQQTHTAAKQTFVCGDCSWSFHSRKELNKHRRAHHLNAKAEVNINCPPLLPSHSQTVLITNDFCQFPVTIVEDGGNVIVHQIEDIGKCTQIVEVSPESNTQIVRFTDSLLQAVVPETQILTIQTPSQQMIHFEGGSDAKRSLPSSSEQNWQDG